MDELTHVHGFAIVRQYPAESVSAVKSGAQDFRNGAKVCIQAVRENEAGENAGCNQNIAAKNASAANNGFSLIREVIRTSVIVLRLTVKRGGRPSVKGAGWPEK